MKKGIENLQAHLFQPCIMLQHADTNYTEYKIIEAAMKWNLDKTHKSTLHIYYFNVLKGLAIYKSISSVTGEIILDSIVEVNNPTENFAGKRHNAVKLIGKLTAAIMSDLASYSIESTSNTHHAVVVLDSILQYPNPEIWYTIKKSIDFSYPITWTIVANHRSGIPHFLDRYVTYPNLNNIIDVNADLIDTRMEQIDELLNGHKLKVDDFNWSVKDRIHPMTISEFNSMYTYLKVQFGRDQSKESIQSIFEIATKMAWHELAKSSNLELIIDNPITFDDLGGLDILKHNMKVAANIFKNRDKALENKVPIPKAIMLQGPQGTGKTESAKAIANAFGAKFVILNIANLFSGRVGDTEANFQMAVSNLQTLAPVVVLIDEADKVLTGTQSSGQSDAGTTSRAMQTLTSFMAEPHPGIFLILTANDPDKIELEFLRKGRTDDIYFVDIPSTAARKEIIAVHLNKVGTDELTIDKIMKDKDILLATNEFTGAEIAESIYDAKRLAFFHNPEDASVTKQLLLTSFAKTIPLAISEADRFRKLREWGSTHAIVCESINKAPNSKYML